MGSRATSNKRSKKRWRSPAAKGDPTEAVHDVRKGFKKVRAALRLAREELGDETYRAENYAFRDAARPLTEVRDAQMLVETFDKLTKALAGEVDAPAIAKVRDALGRPREGSDGARAETGQGARRGEGVRGALARASGSVEHPA